MRLMDYEFIVTGRTESLFATDLCPAKSTLEAAFGGSRVAVVGAAGSIGSAVAKSLLRFGLGSLSLIDLNENALVELVRDIRSTPGLRAPKDFVTMPIGMGSVEFTRYFAEEKPFDYLLNLSAIKHVRSERNIYCLMRMIDTNVLFLHDFLEHNPYRFRKVFSVSSDKAANPANLMGASKMVMEKALLARSEAQPFSTARFANVAFSDGSLPYGFLQRLSKRQPLSAPNDVRRYFISHEEAGQLCVLSCALAGNREIFFPNLAGGRDEKTFAQIALDLLQALGYTPVECSSEEEARQRAAELIPRKRWPCYFFKSDTTGEKEFEEFFTRGERLDLRRYRRVGVIQQDAAGGGGALAQFLSFARRAKTDPEVAKADYVREILKVVPTLQHEEKGRNLDQKM
jgi:nucleoside-diphosphate-sugar epimerase